MSYQRKIKTKPAVSQPVETFTGIEDLPAWLEAQAKAYRMAAPCYLLAHANDGVIWGRLDEDGRLRTSYDALAESENGLSLPSLRAETLQQARLFNRQAELYIWRDGDGGWHGRLLERVQEGETAVWSECFDEPQMLWGTHGTHLAHRFTLLEDGAQGLYHAVPVKLAVDDEKSGELQRPSQLLVRHYLDYDEQGQAYIALSRLVTVRGGN